MKKLFFNNAVSEIYRLFSPNGVIPSERDIRETVKWIYDKGKAKGPAKIGRKGGSVSSDAKKKAAKDREERKREKKS